MDLVKIGNIEVGEFPLLLAPMEDVSDPPFRAVCKENGADMMYTEFISAEGLIRDAAKSLQKLDIYDYERPIGIQIFGEKINSMREAASRAEAAQPELVDINYGCPVKKVACKGAGAGILLDIPKMEEMTREIVKQVALPVTVKTRLGWDDKTIKIIEVALLMPQCAFWLPTKEKLLINTFLNDGGVFPSNMTIRLSAPMVNQYVANDRVNTSSVHNNTLEVVGHICPASRCHKVSKNEYVYLDSITMGNMRENKTLDVGHCGDCRACWDKSIANISYPKH